MENATIAGVLKKDVSSFKGLKSAKVGTPVYLRDGKYVIEFEKEAGGLLGVSYYIQTLADYVDLNDSQEVKINTTVEVKVDTVVEAVRQDLLNRSQVGIKKYGTTLDQNKASLKEWLQHAYEECLDQANYLKRAIMEIDIVEEAEVKFPKTMEMLGETEADAKWNSIYRDNVY